MFEGCESSAVDVAVYAPLLISTEDDVKVKILVESIFPAIHKKAKDLFKDHLEGGKYSNVNLGDHQKLAAKSCMSHNIKFWRG